ncbi:MAG: transposase family protein [Kiritimatiellaeota bacterium]|nr:transposase family protein [Kiritimatiellota bacterium]
MQKLYKNQRTMRAVFGLDEANFNALAVRMDALWYEELASRKGRVRAPGAGQPSKIADGAQKLAFILFYLKVYPTFDVMSVFSGINAGDCCRWVHKLMPVLEKLLGQKQALPKRKINSMEEFAAAFPQAVEVILDGMERPVQRPKKKRRSASIFRGKRRGTHARRLSLWMGNAV